MKTSPVLLVKVFLFLVLFFFFFNCTGFGKKNRKQNVVNAGQQEGCELEHCGEVCKVQDLTDVSDFEKKNVKRKLGCHFFFCFYYVVVYFLKSTEKNLSQGKHNFKHLLFQRSLIYFFLFFLQITLFSWDCSV